MAPAEHIDRALMSVAMKPRPVPRAEDRDMECGSDIGTCHKVRSVLVEVGAERHVSGCIVEVQVQPMLCSGFDGAAVGNGDCGQDQYLHHAWHSFLW
jgi:hypothetical protein